jgi:hypothetical protein
MSATLALTLISVFMAQTPAGSLITTVNSGAYTVTVTPNIRPLSPTPATSPKSSGADPQSYSSQAADILKGITIPKPPKPPIANSSLSPNGNTGKPTTAPSAIRAKSQKPYPEPPKPPIANSSLSPNGNTGKPTTAPSAIRAKSQEAWADLLCAVESCTVLVLDSGKYGCLGGLAFADPFPCAGLEQDLRDCWDALGKTVKAFQEFDKAIEEQKRRGEDGPAFAMPRHLPGQHGGPD